MKLMILVATLVVLSVTGYFYGSFFYWADHIQLLMELLLVIIPISALLLWFIGLHEYGYHSGGRYFERSPRWALDLRDKILDAIGLIIGILVVLIILNMMSCGRLFCPYGDAPPKEALRYIFWPFYIGK